MTVYKEFLRGEKECYQVLFNSVDLDGDVDDSNEDRQRKAQQHVAHQTPPFAPTLESKTSVQVSSS